MALFNRNSKGAGSGSAVRVPSTASRHDGNTAGRDGRRRHVADSSPASPAAALTPAPARRAPVRGASSSSYETGSYGAVDARDAEAQVYARRRREQARRDKLRVVAVVAAAVVVLLAALFATGALG